MRRQQPVGSRSDRILSRRHLLGAGGAGLAVSGLAGCDIFSTEPDGSGGSASTGGGDGSGGGRQAPQLAQQVKKGHLPALGSRLPSEPMKVKPIERAGTYGGTWHTAIEGPTGVVWLYPTCGYEQLVRWTTNWTGAPGTTEIIPNIAKSYHASPDGRTYTFELRPGMRWSDGEPFTADDVVFAQNDVLNNTELFPVQDPNQPRAEKKDSHTVAIVFPEPNSLFLRQQCAVTNTGGDYLTARPKHYLKKFHKKYNPDVDSLVREAKLDSWADLFNGKADIWHNTEIPTLNPWTVTEPLGTGTRVVVQRNPYFWKADEQGRQLPYIDEVSYAVIADPQVMLTRALGGDIDMHCVLFNTLPNKPVLARSRAKGRYRFFDAIRSIANNMDICLNLTHKDPATQKIFQNRDFRIGLSYAMDRKEIIATAFQGQGEPWQQAPPRTSPFYDEEMAHQYTEHSLRKANEHLDKAGFSDRDSNGVRLGPTGEPISFRLEVPTDFDPAWLDASQLLVKYWKRVGIDMSVRTEDRSLFEKRRDANLQDASLARGNGGLDIYLVPEMYCPTSNIYAVQWAEWYNSGGKEGTRPPEPARRQLRLYDKIKESVDENDQARLMRELLAISKEQFWVIGTNLTADFYGIVKDNFHNVPASMPYSWTYPTPGPSNPEQYFITAP